MKHGSRHGRPTTMCMGGGSNVWVRRQGMGRRSSADLGRRPDDSVRGRWIWPSPTSGSGQPRFCLLPEPGWLAGGRGRDSSIGGGMQPHDRNKAVAKGSVARGAS
ncbi:hypothetical protein PR202_ga12364 [Eleusine coracana subsp. coracana]|uniref:Uncharacterized protein n=1 Tax=Eleusine coracana subsp. coracana TaxID=191504 RepID=A0AAV5CBJ7_ELECO|nr:hypothetical protein PR202_ga12364 [Eleusine coracana subsp. coracana]